MAGEHEIQLAGAAPPAARRAAEDAIADVAAHRGQVLAIPRRQRDLSHQRGGRRCRGCGRRRDRRAPELRRPVPRAKRRPVRHHVGRASPRVELPARAARACQPPRSLKRCSRSSRGATSSGAGAACACRAQGWRSTSAASARNTRPTASRRSCSEHGMRHGFVNLGGDIRAIGPQPDGTPWRAGIRHPRVAAQRSQRSISRTARWPRSGDYERYFDLDGKRYCHILDPRTGMPVDALAIGERDGAAVRGRRQLRDDRDAAGRRRAGVPRRARPRVARRRRRRNDLRTLRRRDRLIARGDAYRRPRVR